jgi:hypothetical protein
MYIGLELSMVKQRKELIMVKVRGAIRDRMKVVLVISILSFTTLSLGANEDEELLKTGKADFGPVTTSDAI